MGAIGSAPSNQVALALYDYLLRPAADGTLQPELLTSWDSDDLVTWTLTLRDDVRFHDGTPFDADALVAHLERARDPEVACPCGSLFALVDGIVATGSHEVTVTLTEPWAAFPSMLLATPYGYVPSPTAVAEAGADYGTLTVVGTGPYRLVESVRGERVIVERNDDYWGDAPSFARITFRPIPDEQTRLQSLLAGDVDIITSLQPAVVTEAVANGLDGETFVGLGSLNIHINMSVPPFDDIDVRRALAHGVDRDALNHVVFADGSSPSNGPLSPDSPFASGVTFPQYDPEAARALLEGKGPISFELAHRPDQSSQNMAQVLQQMWGDVGFEVVLRPIEGAQYVPSVRAGDFEVALWTGPEILDPDALAPFFETGGSSNLSGYSNATFDELLDRGRVESDLAAREAIYREAYGILADEAPNVFTLLKIGALAWNDRVAQVPSPETWGVQIVDVRNIYATP
ncbi:MAG TPA: ABC transporter substrate-binding protein [Ilumatobacter sp.]|nr:ABC transporter substrate-binding protein [Ilumatobacter sp.]